MQLEKIAVEAIRSGRYLTIEDKAQRLGRWHFVLQGARYQTAINNHLQQALKELERLQAARSQNQTKEEQEEPETKETPASE